jgi:ppGpp synthetase/RelA/SpoT-type nucleotidyltranferase
VAGLAAAADLSGAKMSKREEWQSQYKILLPALESFRSELARQVDRLLADESVAVGFPLQSRVKEWSSIATKIERVQRVSALRDFQDLVGIRIILLFRCDLGRIAAMIRRHFQIMKEYDTGTRQKTDQFGTQFGYSSLHFVVKPKPEWLTVPTLAGLGDLQAEIQLRTVAQHVWAMASEVLQYKSEVDVPAEMRRSINRVSALLETVDLEFTRVLEQRDEYRTRVAADDTAVLDVDSLAITLDAILPPQNKDDSEDYADLLDNLFNNEIATSADVRELWSKNADNVLSAQAIHVQNAIAEVIGVDNIDDAIADMAKCEGYPINDEILFQLRKWRAGVYWNHVGLISAALRLELGLDA